MKVEVDLRELEIEVRVKGEYVFVNDTIYTKTELFELGQKLLEASNEVFNYGISSHDIKKESS